MNTVAFEEYFDPMSTLIEDATAPEAPEVIYDFIDSHSFSNVYIHSPICPSARVSPSFRDRIDPSQQHDQDKGREH